MKKSELEALGLDNKTIKAVQIIHGKDMQPLAQEAAREGAETGGEDDA